MGLAGPEFDEGLASRGFVANQWLRGVPSTGSRTVAPQTSHVWGLIYKVESS